MRGWSPNPLVVVDAKNPMPVDMPRARRNACPAW